MSFAVWLTGLPASGKSAIARELGERAFSLVDLGHHAPLFPALWRLLPPLHLFRYPEKLLLPFFLSAIKATSQQLHLDNP